MRDDSTAGPPRQAASPGRPKKKESGNSSRGRAGGSKSSGKKSSGRSSKNGARRGASANRRSSGSVSKNGKGATSRSKSAGAAAPKAKEADADPQRFRPVQVLGEDGHLVSDATLEETPAMLLDLYRGMVKIRVLDGRMLNLQRQGRIGFYGQSTGQEAAIVGSAAAATKEDWIVPALREMGVAVYRGYPLNLLVTQLAGKAGEVSQGRQMPCHFSWRAGKFVSMSSVIGTQIPHAAGMARGMQIRGEQSAVLGFLGDGATSSSDFHCGLNFAGVWRSPVVFLCQNNQWAISVPFDKQTASDSIAVKADAYGMPGVRVDGNDVLAVYRETHKALGRARSGGGPTLIEALTYRRTGHSSSDDPTRYRSDEEVATWEKRDPVERLRRFLEFEGVLTKGQHDEMEEEMHREISEATQAVEKLEDPAAESLFEDVFADVTAQLEDQRSGYLHYRNSKPS